MLHAEGSPQVGVVEMDGGRIRTRDEHGQRGVTHPHWREFQAGCVVRLQSDASAEDPRPQVPRLFLNRPKVHKLVSQLHRQRSAPQDVDANGDANRDADGESIGDMLATEKLAENVADQVASPTAAPTPEEKRRRPVR